MRVVIGEDEYLLRRGIASLLTEFGFEVVGSTGDAGVLSEIVDTELPDVVVTDLRMPPDHTDDGLRAAIGIRARHPGIGVVLLSQFVQRRYAVELIGSDPAGAGYLLKLRVADAVQFTADIRRVGEGGTALDPEVVALMVARARRDDRSVDALTARQLQVLALVAEGRSNAAIAVRLGVTERAVVQHTTNIYSELGLDDTADDHRRVLATLRYLTR